MRKYIIIALAGLALSTAALSTPVLSESIPNAGKRDARVRFVTYIENDVVKVDASYGASTMIVFQDDEKVETLAAGDALAWKIEPNKKGNILFIKPVDKKASANLNVVTNKRQYIFQLSAAFRPTSQQVYKVVFKYAEDDVKNPDAAMLAEARVRVSTPNLDGLDVANTNSDYQYRGSSLNKPLVVFDDGTKTFFKFAGDVPGIFLVDRTRHEIMINWRREGDYIVVDKVNFQWTLRAGSEVTCLFNTRQGNIKVPDGLDPYAPKPSPKSPIHNVGVPNAITQ